MLAAGGAASAHASLVDAAPADGAVASPAPERFRLHFNEPVSPTALALIRPDGTRTALERFDLDGTTVVIPAPDALQDGSYGLSWRVVSEDGHPVGGTLVFSVGAPGSAAVPDAAASAGRSLRGAIWATKLLLYIGLFIGAGGVFFTCWIGGRTGRGDGLMTVAMAAGLVAGLLSVGLQGLDMLGRPPGGILAPGPWRTAFASTYARTAILAVMALLCALAARRGIAPRSLSLAGYLGIGLALMASGHVSSAGPHWLTRPAIFVHALTVAFWIGALVPLAGAFAGRAPDAAPDAAAVLARFSRIIPWSVALLVAAGIVMARVQVGAPRALLDTAYGRVFAVKLALLALLFAVAAVNRFRLTAPVMRGEAPAVTRFRRSVLVELALALAIFATVALWRFTPPPRAIAAAEAARQAEAGPALLHLAAGGDMVMVRVAPGRAGPVTAEVRIADMEGDAVSAREVALVLANPAAGIEPIRRRAAAPDEHGAWRFSGLILPAPGDWTLRVEALISDFDLLAVEGTIAIAR